MRKYLLVAMACYFLGAAHMYLDSRNYYRSMILDHREFNWRLIEDYQQSLASSKQLTNNCNLAYATATNCLSEFESCEEVATVMNLSKLNNERLTLEEELGKLEKKIQELIESKKVR